MSTATFFVIIIVGMSLVLGYIAMSGRRKWIRLRRERSELDENALLSKYAAYDNGKRVAKEVRDIICDDFLKSRLPILPSDGIEQTLDIAAEDFDELMERALGRFDLSVDEALRVQNEMPVRTVDDLIQLIINLIRTRQDLR